MPTYEYECLECKNRFDVFQSINDNPIEQCIKCNGKVRKLFGKAGIIFKGSGFYTTDYKQKERLAGGNKDGRSEATPARADSESHPETNSTSD